MDAFLAKHADAIRGVLSCFDRVLFRGSLPLMSGDAMADFLKRKQVKRRTLKTFLLTPADRVKKPALSMAAAAKRPHQYLSGPARKEDLARQIADRDGSEEGLVCVFSVLEPCRTFALVWKEAGLSREMLQRFGEVEPSTLGQAGRIPGVTPAAVALVGAYLERLSHDATGVQREACEAGPQGECQP